MSNKKIKVAVLGFGKMGEAMVSKMLGDANFEICAGLRSEASAKRIKAKYGIHAATDNAGLVKGADVIFLGMKPFQAEAALREIAGLLSPGQLVLSLCAAISLEKLRDWSGGQASVVRVMPNLPAFVGEGMTVYSVAEPLSEAHRAMVEKVLAFSGKAALIPETSMDAATGLSGCGPAFVFLMCEALSDAGVKLGLPRALATQMAAQTLLGSARMVLETGTHPGALKDQVTTPGGCTIEGVVALEHGRFRATVMDAVIAAAQKSEALRKVTVCP